MTSRSAERCPAEMGACANRELVVFAAGAVDSEPAKNAVVRGDPHLVVKRGNALDTVGPLYAVLSASCSERDPGFASEHARAPVAGEMESRRMHAGHHRHLLHVKPHALVQTNIIPLHPPLRRIPLVRTERMHATRAGLSGGAARVRASPPLAPRRSAAARAAGPRPLWRERRHRRSQRWSRRCPARATTART